MDLTKFVTRETAEVSTVYLVDGNAEYYIKVRALNNRERKEKESLVFTESRNMPKTKEALDQYLKSDFEKTEIKYQVGRVRQFEYAACLVDFCLPFLPKGGDTIIPFRKSEHTKADVEKFLDNMPDELSAWIEDNIAKVNKDGKYAEEAAEVKNA